MTCQHFAYGVDQHCNTVVDTTSDRSSSNWLRCTFAASGWQRYQPQPGPFSHPSFCDELNFLSRFTQTGLNLLPIP